jgi:hypothetical protein
MANFVPKAAKDARKSKAKKLSLKKAV